MINHRKILKLHKWWASHYGTMMAFIYLTVAISPSTPSLGEFLRTCSLFTLASLGIGSFGQLLNDLTDIRQDVRSGHQNLVASMGILSRWALFTLILALGTLPWRWLPVSPTIVGLLCAEYLLFTLYSVPPFRLKGRGILGPVADSLYGYVIPNVVGILVFAKLGNLMMPWWLMTTITCWCFLFGLEKIIHHQLIDESRDTAEGVSTFAVTRGWKDALDFTLRIVTPAAALSFALLLAATGVYHPVILIGYLAYLAWTLRTWSRQSLWRTANPRRLPPIDRIHLVSDLGIAIFAWHWFPMLTLGILVAYHPQYLPLFLLHAMLFPEPFRRLRRYAGLASDRLLRFG